MDIFYFFLVCGVLVPVLILFKACIAQVITAELFLHLRLWTSWIFGFMLPTSSRNVSNGATCLNQLNFSHLIRVWFVYWHFLLHMCSLCFPSPAVTCDSFPGVFKSRCCILFLFCHSALCPLGFSPLLCLPSCSKIVKLQGSVRSRLLANQLVVLGSSLSGECTFCEHLQRQFLEELLKCSKSHSYKSTQTSPTFHPLSLICRLLATRCSSLRNLRQLKAATLTDCSYREGKHLHMVLHPLETRWTHYQELHLAAVTDARDQKSVNFAKQNKQTWWSVINNFWLEEWKTNKHG